MVSGGVAVTRGSDIVKMAVLFIRDGSLDARKSKRKRILARNHIGARRGTRCRSGIEKGRRQERASQEAPHGFSHKRCLFEHILRGSLQLIYRIVIYLLQLTVRLESWSRLGVAGESLSRRRRSVYPN